jgi:hypothetical protein
MIPHQVLENQVGEMFNMDYCLTTKDIAIVALAAMETGLIITGQDGALLLPISAIIAGLAGYTVGTTKAKLEVKE